MNILISLKPPTSTDVSANPPIKGAHMLYYFFMRISFWLYKDTCVKVDSETFMPSFSSIGSGFFHNAT